MVQEVCGKVTAGPGLWKMSKVVKGGYSKQQLLQEQGHGQR